MFHVCKYVHCKTKTNKNFVDFIKKKFHGFLKFSNARSHKKFGPDRFSRFNVYWIQTDRQTNKHPDK